LPTSRPVHSLAPARPGQGEKGVTRSASCGGPPRRIGVIASLPTGPFLLPTTIAHADPTPAKVPEQTEALEEEYMELNAEYNDAQETHEAAEEKLEDIHEEIEALEETIDGLAVGVRTLANLSYTGVDHTSPAQLIGSEGPEDSMHHQADLSY